jgi:hypothetical protein
MVMIVKMIRKTIATAALIGAGLLIGCGTSTTGPDGGSKAQTATGVSESGYPAGQPKDAGSPALASSTEDQYSRGQAEKK